MGWQRVGHDLVTKQQEQDELIEIQSDTGAWYQRWGVRALSLGGQVMRAGMVERWRGGQGWSLGWG